MQPKQQPAYREPTKIIAVMQQKGGVGKTTIAKTLGIYFSQRRKVRTLLMDFDPQCNLSNRLLDMTKRVGVMGYFPPVHPDYDETDDSWNGVSSTSELFYGGVILPYPIKQYPGLDILPGEAEKLKEAEQHQPDYLETRIINRVKEFTGCDDVQEAYDMIIIDTPPSRLALTQGALHAATHLIIPTEMETNNIDGLSDMLEMWRNENMNRNEDQQLENIGILPNLYKGTGLHSAILGMLRDDPSIGPFMLPFSIGERTNVAEADNPAFTYNSALELPESNKARKEAEVFCRYVEQKLFGDISE